MQFGKITPPYTTSDARDVLLLHGNGANGSTTIIDSSVSAKTVTAVGNAQISTAQSKFGGASILFDGAGDYLTTPDSNDWYLGTGNFTIDFWVYFNVVGPCGFIGQTTEAGNYWNLYYVGGNLAIYQYNNALWVGIPWSPEAGQWYHIAFVRSGTTANTLKVYINGIDQNASLGIGSWGASFADQPYVLDIGYSRSNGIFLNGYMDEIRFTKGLARWTSNFTPPTSNTPLGETISYNKINFPGFQKIMDFTATGSESSISVTVDGDTDKEYMIFTRDVGLLGIYLRINNDSGSNYGTQQLTNVSGSVTASRTTTWPTIYSGDSENQCFTTISLLTPTGFIKTGYQSAITYISGTNIGALRNYSFVWNNIVNVTLLTLWSSTTFTSGSRVLVYARRSNV